LVTNQLYAMVLCLSAGWVVGIACIILLFLFSVQWLGTDRVGWFFAPAVLIWLVSIGAIGIYNTIKHDYMVLKAFSPVYIVQYFTNNSTKNWVSLGGVLLSITGMICRGR
jgi:KUP system potassium uptake protein